VLLLQVLWQWQQLVPQHTVSQEAPALQHRRKAMLLQHSLQAKASNALCLICCCCCWGAPVVQSLTCLLLLLLLSVVSVVVVRVVLVMGVVGCCKGLHALCHLCDGLPGCVPNSLAQ
jgi:hypothetical protein